MQNPLIYLICIISELDKSFLVPSFLLCTVLFQKESFLLLNLIA